MRTRVVFLRAGPSLCNFTYGRPQGINIVGIPMDGQGMRADLLDKRLSHWGDSEEKKPRVAYIVPFFQVQSCRL
jgi:DNA-binding transcriptional MocR family regulator